ncbi:hypothetical protein D3C76_668410 [compost metagenome]
MPFDLERRADRVDQPLRGVARGIPAVQASEDHGELVATQTGQGVVLAQLAAQALAQGAQQLVAETMAEGVVDVLEVVQVQAQRSGQFLAVVAAHQGLLEPLVEQRAVGQPGERVVMGHVVDLRMGGQLFGGVLGDEQHVVGLPLPVLAEQGTAAQGTRATGGVDARLGRVTFAAARAPGELLFQVVGGGWRQAFTGQAPDHAVSAGAEQAFGLLVGQQDALAVQVLDDDAGGDVGDHRIEELRQVGHFLAVLFSQFLGLQQFQLLLAPLGDVPRDLGETHQATAVIVHGIDHHMGMKRRAILAQAWADLFEAPGTARLLKVEVGQAGGALSVVVEHRVMLADDFLGMVALGTLGAGVPVGDDAVGGEQVDGIVHHALDQQPVHDVGACD